MVMSKTWKWILGVLAALVIVGVVVGAVFLWQNHSALTLARRVNRAPQYAHPAPRPQTAPGAPVAPGTPNYQRRQEEPYGFGRGERNFFNGLGGRMPMRGGRGFSAFSGLMPFGLGFFLLAGLIRWVILIGVLVLVAVLFYQLGKRAGAAAAVQAPPSDPTPPEQPRAGRRVAKR
jgi:predicted lipid-binding transport protein (Tim44 family)